MAKFANVSGINAKGGLLGGNALIRTGAAALIGGAVSKLAGGSFETGAISGAFSQAVGDGLKSIGDPRELTPGEKSLATKIFRDKVDYDKVRIRNGGAGPNRAITPGNQINFNRSEYRDNFSTASPKSKELFVHEMTHVWQHQNQGKNLVWEAIKLQLQSGPYSDTYEYRGKFNPDQFLDMNIEQQATCIERRVCNIP